MEQAKHTKGPWRAILQSDGSHVVVDENNRSVLHRDANEQRTNAALIAAAPDLLKALKKATQDLRSVAIWAKEHRTAPTSWINEKADEVDATIAKAEPKS